MPKKRKSSPDQTEFDFLDAELERLKGEINELQFGETTLEEELPEEDTEYPHESPRVYLWSRLIDFCTRATIAILVISVCTAFAVTSIPQLKRVDRMEQELAQLQLTEQRYNNEREIRGLKIDCLRNDPSYLELRARDRIDYYHPGESVIRIQRPQ